MRLPAVTFALAVSILSICNAASAAEPECYDAKVRAKPVAQVPTVFPQEEGYIVISWPWFVDLSISKVLEGQVDQSEITVLAVLHNRYLDKTRTWLLRRNTLGMFTVLRPENPDAVPRCNAAVALADPYLRPGAGQSLEGYRREGEERYSRFSD